MNMDTAGVVMVSVITHQPSVSLSVKTAMSAACVTDWLTDWLTVLHLTLSITVGPSDWVEWQLTSHRPQQNVKLNFTLVTVMTWCMTWWYGRSKSWSSRQENPDLHIVKHQKVTYTADARRWWTKVILIRVGFL